MTIDRRKLIQGSTAMAATLACVSSEAIAELPATPKDSDAGDIPERIPPGPLRENWIEADACLQAAEQLGNRLRDLHEQLTENGIKGEALGYYCDLNCKLTPLRSEVEDLCHMVGGTLGEWRDRRSGYPLSDPYAELMAEARRHRITVAAIRRRFRNEQRRQLEQELLECEGQA